MQEILQELNDVVGVRGSMVISSDGMVVLSQLGYGLDDETVAAMASRMILTTAAGLNKVGLGAFSRLVLRSSHGRIVLVRAGQAILMAILDPGAALDYAMLDILSAARKIKARGSLENV